MQILGRDALMGASAAAAVAGVPVVVLAEDAALLARVAQFHELYDRTSRSWAKQRRHWEAGEDMPDCPEIDGTAEGNQAHHDFMDAHDAYKSYDECNRLWDMTGALANDIFDTPPLTWRGAVEKFKIAHLAVGSYVDDGDEGLEAYQDWASPWMETVAKDFERLLGGMQP